MSKSENTKRSTKISTKKSKLLFILTGSIACYKACQLVSRLTQVGHEIQVVATTSALKFVGKATLEGLTGRKVLSDLFEEGELMGHIEWARWAELIVVAPATANYINKIAQGLADDLASNLFLAHDFKKPFLLAPAMNTSMYEHPITQASLAKLSRLGVKVLETGSGVLACGEFGYGKLLDPEEIFAAIIEELPHSRVAQVKAGDATALKPLKATRILVTAGGTTEPIDDVRVLSNRSTGATGFHLCQQLHACGFDVTLLLAENSALNSEDVDFDVKNFSSFRDLESLLRQQLTTHEFSHVFHLAAVSDYSLEGLEINGEAIPTKENSHSSSTKFSKLPSGQKLTLHLKENPKLVNQIKGWSLNQAIKLISFKLTVGANSEEQIVAVEKLMFASQSDYVVHNDLSQFQPDRARHAFRVYKPLAASPSKAQGKAELVANLEQPEGLSAYFSKELL